jgi:hypothetical protein
MLIAWRLRSKPSQHGWVPPLGRIAPSAGTFPAFLAQVHRTPAACFCEPRRTGSTCSTARSCACNSHGPARWVRPPTTRTPGLAGGSCLHALGTRRVWLTDRAGHDARIEPLAIEAMRASRTQPAKADAVVTAAQNTFAGTPTMRPTACRGSSTPVPGISSAGKNDPQ